MSAGTLIIGLRVLKMRFFSCLTVEDFFVTSNLYYVICYWELNIT